mgnify:CR=1 FL=1
MVWFHLHVDKGKIKFEFDEAITMSQFLFFLCYLVYDMIIMGENSLFSHFKACICMACHWSCQTQVRLVYCMSGLLMLIMSLSDIIGTSLLSLILDEYDVVCYNISTDSDLSSEEHTVSR